MLIGAAHLKILFHFEAIKIILVTNLSTLLPKLIMLPYEKSIKIHIQTQLDNNLEYKQASYCL